MSSEELHMPPKSKTVLNRIVKTVGNISIKIVPQKWNKNKSNNKKVKCTSA